MNRNHDRAQRLVESWPSWKKEVSLTKYSTTSSNASAEGKGAGVAKVREDRKVK